MFHRPCWVEKDDKCDICHGPTHCMAASGKSITTSHSMNITEWAIPSHSVGHVIISEFLKFWSQEPNIHLVGESILCHFFSCFFLSIDEYIVAGAEDGWVMIYDKSKGFHIGGQQDPKKPSHTGPVSSRLKLPIPPYHITRHRFLVYIPRNIL